MAVKIRLARRGRKALALYDIVVTDVRAPRDGRYIEKLGNYNPNTNPATIVLNEESALKWVMDGAQPTDTTRAILSYKGIMMKKHLQVGVNKGAITQDVADKRFAEWLKAKEAKVQAKIDGLSKDEAAAAKARMDAETKVKEARTEAIQKKEADAIAAVEAEEAAKAAAEAPAAEEAPAEEAAPATEDAPAAEAKEEAPAAEVKEDEAPKAEAKEEAPAAEEAPKEEEK
jgi:small subunit ribosomal protein S16